MDRTLLERFINGACTAEEAARVKQWLEEQPDALDAYLQEVWAEEPAVPMPAALEQSLLQQLQEAQGIPLPQAPLIARKRRWLAWPAAAAAVLLLFSLAWWMWRSNGTGAAYAHTITIQAAGKPLQYTLPDASTVWLRAHARIQLDTALYGQALREVQLLEGEAFFEIQPMPDAPFLVSSGDISTRVLGTSFGVRHARDASPVTVTVASGKVAVSYKKKVLDVLLPGRQIAVDRQHGSYTEKEVPLWMAAPWKEQELQLTRAGFAELQLAMEQLYGVRLRTSNRQVLQQVYNIRLSRRTPVKEVITVLSLLNDNTCQQENDSTFIIY